VEASEEAVLVDQMRDFSLHVLREAREVVSKRIGHHNRLCDSHNKHNIT